MVRYFLTDHLGSTEALTDSSGKIVSSTSYDSFGNATSNIATSYRYTGREYDADTGLYYYRNRWYDPETGRFISEDPIGFAGGDVNLYRYVWSNPKSFVDPYGDVPFLALLLRLFSAGAYVMMNPSYVNAPAPCKPVIRASDEVSVGGILGAAAGMAGGPILGKVAGAVLRGAAGAISKGLSAAGRAIQKAAKSVKRSKSPAPKGINFTRVNVVDPAAAAIARRLGGVSSVRFPGRFKDREFDVFSDVFIGQTKPANFQLGSAFRKQAKGTFEATLELGRKPFFHFDGPPSSAVINKLQEYGRRYGIDPVIDTTPL